MQRHLMVEAGSWLLEDILRVFILGLKVLGVIPGEGLNIVNTTPTGPGNGALSQGLTRRCHLRNKVLTLGSTPGAVSGEGSVCLENRN